MWPAESRPRPSWWLLGLLALLAPALVELVERQVRPDTVQIALESAGVVVVFALMFVWVRKNRLPLELEKPDRPTPRASLVEPRCVGRPSFGHRRP